MLAHLLLILMHLKQSFEKAERLVARRSIYAIRSLFRLMGRDTAYWYRRATACLCAKAGCRLGTLGRRSPRNGY